MFFFLKFPETVRAEEEDKVGPQVPEDPHDSSTDTCPTFPYSSDSPRPFPPSPVHTVTDSPIRISLLTIVTDNPSGDDSPTPILSPIHRSSGHNSPTPTSSTPPVLTFPKLLLLSLLFKPLILQIILSILPIFLVPFLIQDL